MIPRYNSREQFQDAEPNLPENPANPMIIAASAFTPDPFGGRTSPIYVSVNGGNHWFYQSIIPDRLPVDITLRFNGRGDELYMGVLSGVGGTFGDFRIMNTATTSITAEVGPPGPTSNENR